MHLTLLIYNLDLASSRLYNFAIDRAHYHLAGVNGYLALNTRTTNRRLRLQERYSLALHVGTHQCPVHVVMFQERDQRGCYTDGLARRYIHIVHQIGAFHHELALVTSEYALLGEFTFIIKLRVRLGDPEVLLVVGRAIVYFVGDKGPGPHYSIA